MKAGSRFHRKAFDDEKLLDAINEAMAMETVPVHDRESMEAAKRIARLSPRERQVLDKLVAGRLTKQSPTISHQRATVEVHRRACSRAWEPARPPEAARLAVLAQLAPAMLDRPGRRSAGNVVCARCQNRRRSLLHWNRAKPATGVIANPPARKGVLGRSSREPMIHASCRLAQFPAIVSACAAA